MSETILEEANRIINGQRRVDYGPVEESFIDIAKRWTVELGSKLNEPLTPFDVVHLMAQMKLSRAKNGFHRDSYVDICGYAGLTEKLQGTEVVSGLTPTEPEPGPWSSLSEIPASITNVKDRVGDRYTRDEDGLWSWVYGSPILASEVAGWDHYGPFVEVV
jgi:hypothetical protein